MKYRRTTSAIFTAMAAIVVGETCALADLQEWRYSGAAIAGVASIDHVQSSSSPFTTGGRGRVGYGFHDLFEVGANLALATGSGLQFSGAEMHDGNQRQPGDLYANLYALEV